MDGIGMNDLKKVEPLEGEYISKNESPFPTYAEVLGGAVNDWDEEVRKVSKKIADAIDRKIMQDYLDMCDETMSENVNCRCTLVPERVRHEDSKTRVFIIGRMKDETS